MVQVYGFTQLWDSRGNWEPTAVGRLVQFDDMYDVCYGTPCTGIYDQGSGLAGAISNVYLDTDALGLTGFPQVEVCVNWVVLGLFLAPDPNLNNSGFSVRVGFIAYYNPDNSHGSLDPINLRTVLGGVVYDDLVPFLTFNGLTQRIDSGAPPMTTISHTTTVAISDNRTLEVQMLFDLTPTIDAHPYDYYTPFLITDWVSLYVEGRPEKSHKNPRPFIIGMAIGWAIALILLAAVVYFVCVRRGKRKGQQPHPQSQSQVQIANVPSAQPPMYNMGFRQSTPTLSMVGGGTHPSMMPVPRTVAAAPAQQQQRDALGEYAAAHRAYISPELEQKMRMASYFPLDNPDAIPVSRWREHGVSEGELKTLRDLYQMNQGWRQSAIMGGSVTMSPSTSSSPFSV